MRPIPWLPLLAAAALAACGGSDSTPPTSSTPSGTLEIRTMSNRADLVSAGDAMVEIVLPAGAGVTGLAVDIDGRDVSSAFAVRADGRLIGLLTGLANGANVVSARTASAAAASLTVTNAPSGGPVFSGPQTVPFFCATPTPQGATASSPTTNGSGLSAAATDAQCTVAAEYKLYYKSNAAGCTLSLPDPSPNTSNFNNAAPPTTAAPPANGCFKPYDPAAPAPADLVTTTTDAGVTMPYIVRVERGSMNRGIYDIAVLFDPSKPWSATAAQPQWNGKILYVFGASTGQIRRQVRPATNWVSEDRMLSRGYMFIANSMTDSSANSNRPMMSETVMMMKERVADHYGAIRFTMGTGCSGGSINSHTNLSISPGLLDGVTLSCAYPDSETTAIEVGDCVSLAEAYQKPQWTALTGALTAGQRAAKKAAINGHADQTGCHGWYNAFGSNSKPGNYVARVVTNTEGVLAAPGASTNNCQLPAALVYDPVTNPTGARCDAWGWAASIWGQPAGVNRGYDTRDNTGVQYGLKALLSGAITGEEFVTLNEIVGGNDKDANFTTTRTVADLQALDIAYRSGIVSSGRNLAKTPIIDMRGWDDSQIALPAGSAGALAIHHVWRSFSIRDRIRKEYGDTGNQAMWRFGRNGLTPSATMQLDSYLTLDTWLTSLQASTSTASMEVKVRATKPAAAADYCILSSDAAQSSKITDMAICDADPFLKPYNSPRQVAGGPLTEDILKCQLRPINTVEYGGRLDGPQLARLAAVFPGGVCDWNKAGVGQQASTSPLNYSAGPGGVAFTAAPVSKPR